MKKKRRHKVGKCDAVLPRIEVHPTLTKDRMDRLPRIKVECEEPIPDEAITALKERLNFVDHRDLVGLRYIRIRSTVKAAYGDTRGCYVQAWDRRPAEIHMAARVLVPVASGRLVRLAMWLSGKDDLLEVLFHEIGHHKTTRSHSISAYKGEAYAEKYMQAYRRAWRRCYPPARATFWPRRMATWVAYPLVAIAAHLLRYWWRIGNPLYRGWEAGGDSNIGDTQTEWYPYPGKHPGEKEKARDRHPLTRRKYRDKFHIDNR